MVYTVISFIITHRGVPCAGNPSLVSLRITFVTTSEAHWRLRTQRPLLRHKATTTDPIPLAD